MKFLQKNVLKKFALFVLLSSSASVSFSLTENSSASIPQKEKEADPQSSTSNQPQDTSADQADIDDDEEQEEEVEAEALRKINKIIVLGNKYITKEAILNYIPYKVGEQFNPQKSTELIKNLYNGLKRFRTIKVYGENLSQDSMNLYIVVQEKKLLKEVKFEGNKNISEKDITSKVDFADIPAIDEEELKRYALAIKKLYLDKGYHIAQITGRLETEGDQATAIFTIDENKKSLVKRIKFTGNAHVAPKDLRSILYTREDWLLSFMDKSGLYHPERLEADKQAIEQYYQNLGYLTAKVTDVNIDINEQTQNVILTFEIQEGDQYTISDIKAPIPDGQIIPENYLLSQLPLRAGQNYSREGLIDSIKRIENVWGNQGFIFASVEPSIQPDEDKKTVSVAFYSDLGNKVHLNKITIKGNKKTKDKIIRRRLMLTEGEVLTNFGMDASKNRIEGLGFFDQREGVNWKTIRIAEDKADLDLILKEAKTGKFHMKLGWGGAGADLKNPTSGLSVGVELADINLFGSGISVNAETNWAKEQTSFMLHLAQPWLFDRPISGAMDLYHKRPLYDEFRLALPIAEKLTGGALTAGFITRTRWWSDTQILFSLGIDDVRYENTRTTPQQDLTAALADVPLPLKTTLPPFSPEGIAFQRILNREFISSTYVWLANAIEQDERNHPMHASRGYKWKITNKFAIPRALRSNIGYYKYAMDGAWFTPIIGEYALVFKLHGYFGVVTPLGCGAIPFNELYNIGGESSVRGFLFGQIGPKFLGDSIGSRKAAFVNAELIFPITPDFNMKGVLFYDGGAGWDNPNVNATNCQFITNNKFQYRHSVGLGIRMLSPMPIKIDWGFKLDARKDRFDPKRNESASEVHFGTSYEW